MPPTVSIAPGLYVWEIEVEGGAIHHALGSSLDTVINGAMPVIRAERLSGFDPVLDVPPVLTSLTPNTAAIGDPAFTLHVIGTGFKAGDTILWNGSPEPTTFVSATEITTGVDMSTAEVPLAIPVAVETISGKPSNVLTFTLEPAAVS